MYSNINPNNQLPFIFLICLLSLEGFAQTVVLPYVLNRKDMPISYVQSDSMLDARNSMIILNGPRVDTLYLDTLSRETRIAHLNLKPVKTKSRTVFPHHQLSILVDTSCHEMFHISQNGSLKHFATNCFFLINNSKYPIEIETQGYGLTMIQEAQDDRGKWNPVEYWAYSFCGNSYNTFLFDSGSYTLFQFTTYAGDYNTNMRLKIKIGKHILYSEPFPGKITKSQFNKDYSQLSINNYLNLKQKKYYKIIFLEE
jgi:hypothetical protein